jgi:hypothetical protein
LIKEEIQFDYRNLDFSESVFGKEEKWILVINPRESTESIRVRQNPEITTRFSPLGVCALRIEVKILY